MNQKITLLRIQSIPGIGHKTFQKILDWSQSTSQPLENFFELNPTHLQSLFKLSQKSLDALHTSAENADSIYQKLNAQGYEIISFDEVRYPEKLRRLKNPPPILYIKGSLKTLNQAGIAFSGSRKVSVEGEKHTATLTQVAVQQNFNIISGNAKGVDLIAHTTALKANGVTIFVLPHGVLKLSFRQEFKIFQQETPENIVILSEFPPELPWLTQNAMIRNQTIIGLSDAMFIMEAGDSGGTLNAGKTALNMNIPLFVLDYQNPPTSAIGNKILLQAGANPIAINNNIAHFPNLANYHSTTKPGSPKQLRLFDD